MALAINVRLLKFISLSSTFKTQRKKPFCKCYIKTKNKDLNFEKKKNRSTFCLQNKSATNSIVHHVVVTEHSLAMLVFTRFTPPQCFSNCHNRILHHYACNKIFFDVLLDIPVECKATSQTEPQYPQISLNE